MRIAILIILTSSTFVTFAQKRYDANWCFGYKCGLHFDSIGNVASFHPITNCDETDGSFSDTSGALLFYFDNPGFAYHPYVIRNAADSIISNGDSITLDNNCTNGLIILPIDEKEILVFELSANYLDVGCPDYNCRHLSYSIVFNDSMGLRVLVKNKTISNSPVEERMTAVRHANGKDWWLLTHSNKDSMSTNGFVEYLIVGDSIEGPFVQNVGALHVSEYSYIGEMVFNKSGNVLAMADGDQNEVELFKFDRCSGVLSSLYDIQNVGTLGGYIYSCEFSPLGKMLYVTESYSGTSGANTLYQFNVDTSDVLDSKKVIWADTTNFSYQTGQLQIAPDNKIYFATHAGGAGIQDHLGVISTPDSLGAACNFQPFSFNLGSGSHTYFGLPNFPNYNLGPISIYAAEAGKDTSVCKDSVAGVMIGTPKVPNIVYSWSPSAGLSDTTAAQPTAKPDSDTYYILTVVDTSQTGNSCTSRSDTVLVTVKTCGVGINEVQQSLVKVYPNPASKELIIENSAKENAVFILYDLLSKEVKEKTVTQTNNKLDVSNLPEGLYIYHINNLVGKVQILR